MRTFYTVGFLATGKLVNRLMFTAAATFAGREITFWTQLLRITHTPKLTRMRTSKDIKCMALLLIASFALSVLSIALRPIALFIAWLLFQ